MKKYYFANTLYSAYGQDEKPQTFVCDVHPFEAVASLNETVANYETTLLSWQEITKEEYDLYKKLND